MLMFAICLAIVLSLISYGINYVLRNKSIFGNYKSFFLLLTVLFIIALYTIPYATNCYSILYSLIYAWLIVLGMKIRKVIKKKDTSFKTFSKWFGYGMIILSFLMAPGVQISMIVYGILWLLLFVFGWNRKINHLVSKLYGGKPSISDFQSEIVKTENFNNTNMNEKTTKAVLVKQKVNDKLLVNKKDSLWMLIAVLVIVAFGIIMFVVNRGHVPSQSGQYIYWILGIIVAIISAVMILSKVSKNINNIGIVLSVLAMTFLILGVNYYTRLSKANENFATAKQSFNASYEIMKTGEDINQTGEEISNNPLVKEYDDDDYDEDDSEENRKIDRDVLRDMTKDLRTMKNNDTGKYDYEHYKDKYVELVDNYNDTYY